MISGQISALLGLTPIPLGELIHTSEDSASGQA